MSEPKVQSDVSLGIITDENEIKKNIDYLNSCHVEGKTGKEKEEAWESSFSEWRYKMHLGEEIYISTEDSPRKLKKGEFLIIKPGEFVLLTTAEKLTMKTNVMAFISMRSHYKYRGLINVSGFHVDPGYEGKLIFSAYNAGPNDVVVRRDDPMFLIFFEKIAYNCKTRIGYDCIPSEMVENIRGKSNTLAYNAHKLEQLEFYMKVIGSIVVSLGIGLLIKWLS